MPVGGDVTKTQVDRLGDRLRKGELTESDLQLLDSFRRSFTDAYENVIQGIRDKLGLEPTGRPAKSTTSVIEKLRRESIRLTQIYDIAGCRLIVGDVAEQDHISKSLMQLFENSELVDRRESPSYGYRSVHIVVTLADKQIEIQIRTRLQHLWAELSEKFSDVIDPAIKYGGGDEQIRSFLSETSKLIEEVEVSEKALAAELVRSREYLYDVKRKLADFLQSQITKLADDK